MTEQVNIIHPFDLLKSFFFSNPDIKTIAMLERDDGGIYHAFAQENNVILNNMSPENVMNVAIEVLEIVKERTGVLGHPNALKGIDT
jgi:hypothetical protein